MIDFHCHLLQGIDDGSRSVETSINILERSREQGVRTIIATPHFHASKMSIDSFLKNRKSAYEELTAEVRGCGRHFIGDDGLSDGLPKLLLGAETAFFDNMSVAERVGDLTIQGTNILMVEMPFVDWQESHLREIEKLSSRYTVIIAHIERFMNRRNKRRINELLEMSRTLPIRIQVNAEAFDDRKLRRKLIKMFASGEAHMLGSDCHGMNRRPPNLPAGMNALRAALGDDFLRRMNECNKELLRGLI